jgi:hypothetical protein
MHTHFSATTALSVFLVVLVLGTLWRLIASHLAVSNNPMLNHIGSAMIFQY